MSYNLFKYYLKKKNNKIYKIYINIVKNEYETPSKYLLYFVYLIIFHFNNRYLGVLALKSH